MRCQHMDGACWAACVFRFNVWCLPSLFQEDQGVFRNIPMRLMRILLPHLSTIDCIIKFSPLFTSPFLQFPFSSFLSLLYLTILAHLHTLSLQNKQYERRPFTLLALLILLCVLLPHSLSLSSVIRRNDHEVSRWVWVLLKSLASAYANITIHYRCAQGQLLVSL